MKKLPMRKICEVFRLKFEHQFSERRIARSCNISRSTVSDYLARFKAGGLCWPLLEDMSETALEQCLFPPLLKPSKRKLQMPDWSEIHEELRRPGVTLIRLWQEYNTNRLTTVMSMGSWTTEQGGMTSNSRAIARNYNAELKFR